MQIKMEMRRAKYSFKDRHMNVVIWMGLQTTLLNFQIKTEFSKKVTIIYLRKKMVRMMLNHGRSGMTIVERINDALTKQT